MLGLYKLVHTIHGSQLLYDLYVYVFRDQKYFVLFNQICVRLSFGLFGIGMKGGGVIYRFLFV